jgi:hypothetical protein
MFTPYIKFYQGNLPPQPTFKTRTGTEIPLGGVILIFHPTMVKLSPQFTKRTPVIGHSTEV